MPDSGREPGFVIRIPRLGLPPLGARTWARIVLAAVIAGAVLLMFTLRQSGAWVPLLILVVVLVKAFRALSGRPSRRRKAP